MVDILILVGLVTFYYMQILHLKLVKNLQKAVQTVLSSVDGRYGRHYFGVLDKVRSLFCTLISTYCLLKHCENILFIV